MYDNLSEMNRAVITYSLVCVTIAGHRYIELSAGLGFRR